MFISLISLFCGVIFFAFAPIGNFLWIYISASFITFLLPIFKTLRMTLTHISVPIEKMGRFVGFFMVFNSLSLMLGYLIVGPLAELIGIVPLYISSGVLAIIIIVLLYFFTDVKQLDAISIIQPPQKHQKEETQLVIKKIEKIEI